MLNYRLLVSVKVITDKIFVKTRILADSIRQYIGYDKSILAYQLSVKFNRYANPENRF